MTHFRSREELLFMWILTYYDIKIFYMYRYIYKTLKERKN